MFTTGRYDALTHRRLRNVIYPRRFLSLDGWWIARAATLGGVRLPAEALSGLAMLVFDSTLYLGGDVGTIDVDHERHPATIDILITDGPNRWRFIPGIVDEPAARVRLCLDLSGVRRPSTFESAPGSRVLLVTCERMPTREAI